MPEINAFTHSLLNLLPVSLAIKKGRLWWLGHVEHKDDADWVEWRMLMETKGTGTRDTQREPWWNLSKGLRRAL